MPRVAKGINHRVEQAVRRLEKHRTQRAKIWSIDGNYADIKPILGVGILTHVEIYGDPSSLQVGDNVLVMWVKKPGAPSDVPVIITQGYGNNSDAFQNIGLITGSMIAYGQIQPEHLGFSIYDLGSGDMMYDAGWRVTEDGEVYAGYTYIHPSGQITLGRDPNILKMDSQHATYRMWIGDQDPTQAVFSVEKDGSIFATAGSIAGWTLATNSFTADSGNAGINAGASPYIQLGGPTGFMTGTGIWMGKDTDTTYKLRVGDPAGDHMYWDGSQLFITGTFVGDADISATDADTFTINADDDNVNVGLIFMHPTQDLTMTWSGSVLDFNVGSSVLYLNSTGLGIGIAPPYPLTIRSTSQPQLAIQYDASNYVNLYATSSGHFYAYSVGNQIFRRTTADTAGSFFFMANNESYINIRSNYDASAPASAGIIFQDNTTNYWGFWKNADNKLLIYDYNSTSYILEVQPSADVLWTPSGTFRIQKGGEQLRLAYDASYYTQFTVNSSGVLTIDAVGDAVVFQTNNKIGSVDFTSQLEGWEIDYTGNADFRYIYADELQVKAFTAEIYSALVGALIITKSRARLSRDFRIGIGYTDIVGVNQANDYFSIDGNFYTNGAIQAGDFVRVINSTGNDNTYSVDSVAYDSGNDETDIYVTIDIPSAVVDGTIYTRMQMYVEDLEELEDTAVFDASGGDWVLLRHIDMSGGGLIVSNVWCRAWTYDQTIGDGEQSWLMHIVDAGVNNASAGGHVYSGSIALDYGQSGDGTWEATVLDQGNSPYSQVTTWATDPSVPANFTTWVRTGNLDGIGTLPEQYGIWMGQGTDENNDSQIIMSNLGARIINTDLYVKASGTNRVIASTSGYISAGATAPTTFGSGVGFWAGIDATYAKIMIGNTSGNWLSYDSNTGYLDIKSGANTYGRWDAGTITLGLATGAGGRAVLSSTGVFLYGNNENTVAIQSSGNVRIGTNGSGDAYMEWDPTGGTSGGGRLNFRKTASVQLYVDDDGALYSGSRTVKLDSNGVSIDAPASAYGAASAFKFYDSFGGNLLGGLYGRWISATPNANYIRLHAAALSGFGSTIDIDSECTTSSGSYANTVISANYNSGAQIAQVSVYANATTGTVVLTGLSGITFLGDMKTSYGLAVGDSALNPANGEIFVTGDVVMAGGLMVGSTSYTTDVTNGHIWFNDSGLRIYDNGSNLLKIYNANGYVDIGGNASDQMTFSTGDNLFLFNKQVYSSGALVSTTYTHTTYATSVSNSMILQKNVADGHMHLNSAANSVLYLNWYGNSTYTRAVYVGNGQSTWGNIHAASFPTESNRASKRDVRLMRSEITSALDVVDRINPVKYKRSDPSSDRYNKDQIGIIAEELYEVLPEVVVNNYDTGEPQGIDYGQIVPLLIQAIQELKEEVRRLQ